MSMRAKFRRWRLTHHKTVITLAVIAGYLLHLSVEGLIIGYAGAKLQALGYLSV